MNTSRIALWVSVAALVFVSVNGVLQRRSLARILREQQEFASYATKKVTPQIKVEMAPMAPSLPHAPAMHEEAPPAAPPDHRTLREIDAEGRRLKSDVQRLKWMEQMWPYMTDREKLAALMKESDEEAK